MWQELLTPILEVENPNQDWINDLLVCYESEVGDNSLWGIENVGIIFSIKCSWSGSWSVSGSWNGTRSRSRSWSWSRSFSGSKSWSSSWSGPWSRFRSSWPLSCSRSRSWSWSRSLSSSWSRSYIS